MRGPKAVRPRAPNDGAAIRRQGIRTLGAEGHQGSYNKWGLMAPRLPNKGLEAFIKGLRACRPLGPYANTRLGRVFIEGGLLRRPPEMAGACARLRVYLRMRVGAQP